MSMVDVEELGEEADSDAASHAWRLLGGINPVKPLPPRGDQPVCCGLDIGADHMEQAAHEALDGKVVLAVVRESEMHVLNVVHWIGDSQRLLPSCQQTTERGEVNHTHRAHHEQPPVTHMHADVAPHRSMLTHGE